MIPRAALWQMAQQDEAEAAQAEREERDREAERADAADLVAREQDRYARVHGYTRQQLQQVMSARADAAAGRTGEYGSEANPVQFIDGTMVEPQPVVRSSPALADIEATLARAAEMRGDAYMRRQRGPSTNARSRGNAATPRPSPSGRTPAPAGLRFTASRPRGLVPGSSFLVPSWGPSMVLAPAGPRGPFTGR